MRIIINGVTLWILGRDKSISGRRETANPSGKVLGLRTNKNRCSFLISTKKNQKIALLSLVFDKRDG